MAGCKADSRQKKKTLITATYPQAEGLHQVAQRERDGEEEGGGVNTALTSYSEANHTGWHINIVLSAIAVGLVGMFAPHRGI